MKEEKDYLDLSDALQVDTYLIVKFGNNFAHYGVPRERKDGTLRQYGDLYTYFTKQKDFRFAMGLLLKDEGDFWSGVNQYFYFDKKEFPHLHFKETIKYTVPKRK